MVNEILHDQLRGFFELKFGEHIFAMLACCGNGKGQSLRNFAIGESLCNQAQDRIFPLGKLHGMTPGDRNGSPLLPLYVKAIVELIFMPMAMASPRPST
jgi:hypothetical protein